MAVDYRCEFADFGSVAYMNAAYQGPLPLASVRAAQEALAWKTLPYRIPEGAHFDLPDSVRGKIAQIISAEPDEIAIANAASSGMAAVAVGMDWKSGDEITRRARRVSVAFFHVAASRTRRTF